MPSPQPAESESAQRRVWHTQKTRKTYLHSDVHVLTQIHSGTVICTHTVATHWCFSFLKDKQPNGKKSNEDEEKQARKEKMGAALEKRVFLCCVMCSALLDPVSEVQWHCMLIHSAQLSKGIGHPISKHYVTGYFALRWFETQMQNSV